MDKIRINGLTAKTIIGVHDWEKSIKQSIVLDIEMSYNCLAAARSDDLADALDYQMVSEKLTAYIESSSFELIETLAEQCADMVLQSFPVKHVKLTLHKPDAIKNANSVAIQIKRKS